MTTARTTTRKPAPQPVVKELTAGERIAADLRVLADLAASTPPVADDLADALKEVTVVLRVNGGGHEVLAAALAKHNATDAPAPEHDELFFDERAWLLPNRAITLSAVSLNVSVEDIEAAGR
jgi:hypothetical protein